VSENFLVFSKPFIKATKETFATMVHTEVKLHSPRLKDGKLSSADITALIGMSGKYHKEGKERDFKGLLALSFNEKTFLKMASRLLGEDYTKFVPDIADSGAELCNIILGNSKSALKEMGIQLDLTTPSTIRGPEHEINYPHNSLIVETTISSDLGEDFYLNICYQDMTK
jgi:CheY-specific phosphatase CheX